MPRSFLFTNKRYFAAALPVSSATNYAYTTYIQNHDSEGEHEYELTKSSSDETDSDSGCSIPTTDSRSELTLSDNEYSSLECKEHTSFLFDLMGHSPQSKPSCDSNDWSERYFQTLQPAVAEYSINRTELETEPRSPPLTTFELDATRISSLSDTHICIDCGKRYSTSSNLARHRQTHRSVSDKKARKCPHCEKVYVSMPAYSMHVRTHTQGCACPYCGKRFSRPWLLQGHIRTHTGEKPFSCPKCGKAFADKSNLRAHIQTHSTEKPYVCGRCGKAFALKSYLYKHEESSCMRGQRYRH
ncbi:finger SNAI2-like [Octopus vulgaris]|uniref:Finger SNAI2-like n=2 Tax=Octopus TaxID=6643 RepID=A0AA36FG32_OCTVU|nr:finger SNAI2-like [Octopus vulgaris]